MCRHLQRPLDSLHGLHEYGRLRTSRTPGSSRCPLGENKVLMVTLDRKLVYKGTKTIHTKTARSYRSLIHQLPKEEMMKYSEMSRVLI